MGKVRFRCREMVKIKFLDYNVVPGSTLYVDPGTHPTQQNQFHTFHECVSYPQASKTHQS